MSIPRSRPGATTRSERELTCDQGSGKGQMAAWKSSKAASLYEERGGSYESKAGSKNEPTKGKPEAKSAAKVRLAKS